MNHTVTLDTQGPPAPTLNGAPASATSIALSGTAGGDATTVKIYQGTQVVDFADVVGGQFARTLTVNAGTHTYTARSVDPLGNESAASAPVTVTVGPPEAPTLDSATADGHTVTVKGRTGARALKVRLVQDSEPGTQITVGPNAPFEFIVQGVPDGVHQFYAIAYDGDDVPSAHSATRTVVVDTVAPNPPTLVATRVGASGVTLSGDAAGATQVRLQEGSEQVGLVNVANGKYTLTLSNLSPGTHTYRARALDAANNLSELSEPASVTIVAAPQPPEAPTLDSATVDGSKVTLSGRAGARTASVELFVDGRVRWDAGAGSRRARQLLARTARRDAQLLRGRLRRPGSGLAAVADAHGDDRHDGAGRAADHRWRRHADQR